MIGCLNRKKKWNGKSEKTLLSLSLSPLFSPKSLKFVLYDWIQKKSMQWQVGRPWECSYPKEAYHGTNFERSPLHTPSCFPPLSFGIFFFYSSLLALLDLHVGHVSCPLPFVTSSWWDLSGFFVGCFGGQTQTSISLPVPVCFAKFHAWWLLSFCILFVCTLTRVSVFSRFDFFFSFVFDRDVRSHMILFYFIYKEKEKEGPPGPPIASVQSLHLKGMRELAVRWEAFIP